MAITNFIGPCTGDFSEFSATTGTVSVVSALVGATSPFCLQVNPATSSIGSVPLSNLATTGQWVSFRFRYATRPASNYEPIAAIYSGAYLHLLSDGRLQLITTGMATVGGTTTTVLQPDTWYDIEVYFVSSTGLVEVYVNREDTPQISHVCPTSGTSYVNLGKVVNKSSNTVDYFYGTIVLSDERLPAAMSIVKVSPASSTPAYDDWTKTPFGSLLSEVWDNIPFSASSSAYCNLTNGAQTLVMDVAGAAGLASSSVIGAAKQGMVAKTASTSSGGALASIRRVVNGSPIDSSITLATTDKYFQTVFNPTYSELSGIEIGVLHGNHTKVQYVEDCWLWVLYADGTGPSGETADYTYAGSGSLGSSGSATASYGLTFASTSTLSFGGSAVAVATVNRTFTGNGSLYVAGTAPPACSFHFSYTGTGSTGVSGAASTSGTYDVLPTADFVLNGSGTASLSGSSQASSTYNRTYAGSGNTALSGTASTSITHGHAYAGSGSASLYGAATTNARPGYSHTGNGVLTVNGSAQCEGPNVKQYGGNGAVSFAGTASMVVAYKRSYQAAGSVSLTLRTTTTEAFSFLYVAAGTCRFTGTTSYHGVVPAYWSFDEIKAVPLIAATAVEAHPAITVEATDARPQITSEDMQSHVVITVEGFTT